MQPVSMQPAGLLWTWWRGDHLPLLPALIDFTARRANDDQTLSHIAGLSCEDIRARRKQGHCPYMASIATTPVGYGWSAANTAVFGSPPLAFTIPPSVRYLRDFAILPSWRGRGIYSHLLQAIIQQEASDVTQFWIVHQWTNQASARGIAKAGFHVAGQICFLPEGGLSLRPDGDRHRASIGAALLGLPFLGDTVQS